MDEWNGYHDCPCRDCFEIAIGADENDESKPALCWECKESGCDLTGESECESPSAYGDSELAAEGC